MTTQTQLAPSTCGVKVEEMMVVGVVSHLGTGGEVWQNKGSPAHSASQLWRRREERELGQGDGATSTCHKDSHSAHPLSQYRYLSASQVCGVICTNLLLHLHLLHLLLLKVHQWCRWCRKGRWCRCSNYTCSLSLPLQAEADQQYWQPQGSLILQTIWSGHSHIQSPV